ncbi:MAG: acyl-CoA dehydrogenase family protein [Mycetocola sp.]
MSEQDATTGSTQQCARSLAAERARSLAPQSSERVRSLLARSAEPLARIAATAVDADREHRLPVELVRELAATGFTRVRVPVADGGDGVTLPELTELLIALGAADASLPNALRGHFSFVEILRQEPNPLIRDRWVAEAVAGRIFGNGQTEPAPTETSIATGGGDTFRTTTRLSHEATGWRLTGTKIYSSGALYADWLRVSARTEDGRLSWAIVDALADGVDRQDDWDGFGQRLSASGSTRFAGAPVEPLGVFPIGNGVQQHQSFVQLVHLATLAGIAERVRDDAIVLLRGRTRPGFHALDPVPAHDPLLLGVIGELAEHAATARALALAAAQRLEEANTRLAARGDGADGDGGRAAVWQEGDNRASDRDRDYAESYLFTATVQQRIIESTLTAATALFGVGGSSAVGQAHGLDRHWRNARTIASHNPVVYKASVVGDYLVNGTLPGTFWPDLSAGSATAAASGSAATTGPGAVAATTGPEAATEATAATDSAPASGSTESAGALR